MPKAPLDAAIDRALSAAEDPLDALWGILGWYDSNGRKPAASSEGLGCHQRAILATAYARLDENGQARWLPRPVHVSESKALSRALRDLERRGLIVRLAKDGRPGLPTYWIRLTPAGTEAARQLELREAA